ncbi:hypothetical protein [Kitasatospora griseola]|uniref:hypothetical protein n=1 Tax=Kitasatospora griseola TaxID=2064 RepID=UPI0034471B5E
MSPDRRLLELAFSEPAVDQVLLAAEPMCPLPAQSSPFLEPNPTVPVLPAASPAPQA